MNNLIKKYRKDELTPEELAELREQVNSVNDPELEQPVFDLWMHEDFDTSAVDDERMQRIKGRIDQATGDKKRFRLSTVLRWTEITAAILLPVFMVMTFYLYRENTNLLTEEMVIETGLSERAGITLPDGSVVTLNSESRLVYLPKDYNKKERKITFGGEGYFQVKQDMATPFLINAKGLQVKVLGTTFNLLVRETDRTAELALEDGSVSLLSTRTNRQVVLKVNQKAILDYATGEITVIYDENIKDISAWRRGDMVFRNTPFRKVIQTIEENYNVRIQIECTACLDDTFTGPLPVNNLNEVLEVIERSFHLKAVISGKEILLK